MRRGPPRKALAGQLVVEHVQPIALLTHAAPLLTHTMHSRRLQRRHEPHWKHAIASACSHSHAAPLPTSHHSYTLPLQMLEYDQYGHTAAPLPSCPQQCSLQGVCITMKGSQAAPRCLCHKGFTGANCSEALAGPWDNSCYNRCSGGLAGGRQEQAGLAVLAQGGAAAGCPVTGDRWCIASIRIVSPEMQGDH